MKLADRIKNLGTETAFAVGAEAAVFAAKGNKVYPFHLGDLNIATPQNVVDASLKAIKDGKTGYCPNAGVPALREALAEDINKSHGMDYTMENVIIQPGGKPVIGKFILALMNPGDEVLYPNPGYPIYESQIQFNGGVAVPYSYKEGADGFLLDLDSIEKKITDKTKLLIFNDFQNPMAAEASVDELKKIAALAIKHNLFVLCDEAYFDMRYSGKSKSLASLPGMKERCVLLYTFSKKFAMTGWRLGAAIAPKEIAAILGKLNTNDESCSNHFVQYGALAGLTGDQSPVKAIVEELRKRRDKGYEILNSIKGFRCFKPETTFYLFPNVTEAMNNLGFRTYDEFRVTALEKTGVSFCTRLHFGSELPGEKNRYVRFAYSGINIPEMEEGLAKLKAFIEK
ncbi:aminotransferase class I/II-fold pyridoxal phosphate-dependent enzyme [bacterium]|nr:aminotransferase class I/II-fold pyridoxal phosphate-dependent enzyme [Candidatus Omnitrophota bacterium]MBU2528801.1 aminotransferase class I/II-fold pyridoxal phosphate-dependent enzyme [bacterium]MBU3929084.1 aminotransferase class I/II-fold pyridoxal phosphate-dependent enzyme [bacterium]MBU4122310.1 aminotransferase class I/II-fold pyridoxal phosphate-dependent enzyme [bacterium]